MNEADARKTLRSEVIGILSSNKWQGAFNFTINNSMDLAEDIANSIYDNCNHCFEMNHLNENMNKEPSLKDKLANTFQDPYKITDRHLDELIDIFDKEYFANRKCCTEKKDYLPGEKAIDDFRQTIENHWNEKFPDLEIKLKKYRELSDIALDEKLKAFNTEKSQTPTVSWVTYLITDIWAKIDTLENRINQLEK